MCRLQSRGVRHQKKKEGCISLHVILCYLVLGSDHGECLVTCCKFVVPREVSKRPACVLNNCGNYKYVAQITVSQHRNVQYSERISIFLSFFSQSNTATLLCRLLS